MNYIVVIEGQNIPLPEEIAVDDAKVRQALAPFFPDAANAMITRTKGKDEETTLVNVVKKAGSKGAGTRASPYEHLRACKGGMNPALAMYQRLQAEEGELDAERLIEIRQAIEQAVKDGEEQLGMVQTAAKRLQAAQAQAAPGMMAGF
jgi:hypothetical protein